MGYPKETIDFLQLKTLPVPSVIASLDLIPYGNSYKYIGINADIPAYIDEFYRVNGAACDHFGYRDPNEGMKQYLDKAVNLAVRTNQ